MKNKKSRVLQAVCLAALWLISCAAIQAETKGQEVTIAACGDVMMQNVDGGKRLSDGDLARFMAAAGPWFKSAQIGLVNLEGPIGGSEPKGCQSEHCYRFSQGPLTGAALSAIGVNTMALANNHANDMGASGQRSTKQALDQIGARYAGHFDAPSTRWSESGVSVELLAMTANRFAPDFRAPEALDAVRAAKARSDVVILSLHMGCEGAACARLKGGQELFLGEDRGSPAEFSRKAIDAGADLILGSGPHVPRALGFYKNRLIAYSLGNCAAGPGLSTAGKSGWAPVLWARLSKQGRLLGWDVGSFVGDGRKMEWDSKERALAWMLEATLLDSGAKELGELEARREARRDIRPVESLRVVSP